MQHPRTPSLFMAVVVSLVAHASGIMQASVSAQEADETAAPPHQWFQWEEQGAIPDVLGVAGPFVGVSNGELIVAGGANFAMPVWESEKQWHSTIYSGIRTANGIAWSTAGQLERPTGYGCSVTTDQGILCMGGNDARTTFASVQLLSRQNDESTVRSMAAPSLPAPRAYAGAALIGSVVYLACGSAGTELATATNTLWALDTAKLGEKTAVWIELPKLPGPRRAFPIVVAQHNGFEDCLYVISGRTQSGQSVEFLRDVWEYSPSKQAWRRRKDAPRCVMAGTGIDVGQSHLLIMGGADGSLFDQADQLRDDHPGFPRESLAYHTITNTWVSAGPSPVSQVTTTAVRWGDQIIIPSGELRPRVRTPKVWSVSAKITKQGFGFVNYTVLLCYLASMIGIGVFFAWRSNDTNDYFRGGKNIPWWAAGCSIFATMLSSLTFTGIPSKAYAQDWVYSIGNLMIPVVAFVAVYLALPFFRRIDATSAYEYLEKRFSRPVRWFGSLSFMFFHVFRMAVVLSLTGLALSVATPLTPAQAVLAMGLLSILYCTMGGIEAVIWTDTVQAIVLLGGAACALFLLIQGTDGAFSGFVETGQANNKFRIANWHLSPFDAQIAFWVIVVGAIAQNISSYTSDQAVVQRYMTTADQRAAEKSIWTNALLSIPATILFFAIGSALFAFYRSHPERLEPSMTTDQIFPLFIAREMPNGLAGLIVAGIFAAAQSTVSTSMNSIATTVVIDFLKPLSILSSDRAYLRSARILTALVGVVGTAIGLLFVDPEIKSLFDAFIVTLGLFMGVLGGLFCLGALTTRANAAGALTGSLAGTMLMLSLWSWSNLSGYLYTACGILTCFVVGYLASLLGKRPEQSIAGLTIHTLH